MGIIEYTIDEKVAILTMNDGENRFNPSFLKVFPEVLDEIEQKTDANALVVTSSHEKIFCNGIDLDWLNPLIKKGDKESATAFLYTINELLKRILL